MFDDPMFGGYARPTQLPRVGSLDEFNQIRIPPNSTVAYFHNSEDLFFVKSSDQAGQCSATRAFRFTEIDVSELTPVTMNRADYNKMMEVFEYVKQFVQTQQQPAETTEQG